MRREERRLGRVLAGVTALGLVAAAVFPFALYQFGLWVAPPRPVPGPAGAPPLVLDALWARAEGGRATELRALNPLRFAEFLACMVAAEGQNDNERATKCSHVIPAGRGLEYLATLHLRDNGVERNSFRGGHAQFGTVVWMTRSWSKADFLNTLAARGDFGFGWRGITDAAHGYLSKEPGALTVSEAAFLASRIGDSRADAWCDGKATIEMRGRVLTAMRDNGAISDAQFDQAQAAAIDLAPPPADHANCRD